jgi:type II secretory pathway pseudopilin PulG
VIAIIALLTGVVLGVGRRATQSAKIAKAKAELSVLSIALETYKRQYGDYPQTGAVPNDADAAAAANDGPGILFNALVGKRGPKATLVAMSNRAEVELAKFTLQSATEIPGAGPAQMANAFVDPWGHRYLYYYKTGGSWLNSSFVLLSQGPDETASLPIPDDGLIGPVYEALLNAAGNPVNADNLYANRD